MVKSGSGFWTAYPLPSSIITLFFMWHEFKPHFHPFTTALLFFTFAPRDAMHGFCFCIFAKLSRHFYTAFCDIFLKFCETRNHTFGEILRFRVARNTKVNLSKLFAILFKINNLLIDYLKRQSTGTFYLRTALFIQLNRFR